jgi:hypothetical protein
MAPCRGGLLGWLWSLFGSTTPAYAGEGQPSQGRGWCDAVSTTPTYQSAPKEPPPKGSTGDIGQSAGNGVSTGVVRVVIQHE